MRQREKAGTGRRALARMTLGAVLGSVLVGIGPVGGQAATSVRDGSTSDRAAASCWEIVQSFPGSPSGTYWLQTPKLIAPQQFHCDMDTDGGGWVLVGRGREAWDWSQLGQGSPAAIADIPAGPQAFSPATLPASTVDGLLNGERLDQTDGIRLRRALNTAGTDWQTMTIKPTNRENWTWAFGGGIRFSSLSIAGSSTHGAGLTNAWGADQSYRRLATTDIAGHGYLMGFGYGASVNGSNSGSSHLWTRAREGYALPFTQVYIRPRTTSPDYGTIPAAGLPASAQRPMMANTTTPVAQPWGVTGRVGVPAGNKNELNMEVQDMAFVGDTVFVGGMFEYVQKGATPAPQDKIRQPYLAAFDINTGEWKPQFRPELNGSVWSLAALPDGRLAVGGDFTDVNGEAGTSHLAALDPETGAVVPGWRVNAYVNADGSGQVRSLDVQGDWLYVGGRFNRLGGGDNLGNPLTLSNLGRVKISDGTADGTWKPHLNARVYELDASDRGDRVHLVGNFSEVNFTPRTRVASVDTASGALVPGLAPLQPAMSGNNPTTATYQQTVLEVGDGVYVGGAEHILTRYDRDTFSPSPSSLTRQGGDFQALAEKDGVVYGACHCIHYNYFDTRSYSSTQATAADVTRISFIGAWDAETGVPLPEFLPQHLDGRNDSGPWVMRFDANECLWFGGDFTRGSRLPGGGYQWLGGFGKMCPRDSTAPTAPTALTTTPAADGTIALAWQPGSDENGAVSYEVLRDDRVIATTNARSWTDTSATLPAGYWVRAVDQAGNRSATTERVGVQAPDTVAPSQVSGLATTEITGSTVALTWQAATDDTAVTGYDVLRGGEPAVTGLTGTTWTDTTVTPGRTYAYQVIAFDAAGNRALPSEPVEVVTPGATSVVMTETFTGPDTDQWPSAWTPDLLNGTSSVSAEEGVLAVDNVTGAASRVMLADEARTDTEVVFSFAADEATAGTYLSVFLRGSGGWQNAYRPVNGYGVQFSPRWRDVILQANVNGSIRTLTTVQRETTTGKQWVRFQVVGDQVRVRVWADGEAEPVEWLAVASDSQVTDPGVLHLALSRAGAATSPRSMILDDITYTRIDG